MEEGADVITFWIGEVESVKSHLMGVQGLRITTVLGGVVMPHMEGHLNFQ